MAETLQEFLVSLKYKQEGRQEFVDGVEKAGGTVLRVGAAIATAMTGVALAVSKYAQSMEQLDFIALRTKTTVDNLRALQTAGASLGSTAAGMTSSLEGVSRFMRNTPGSSSFLASMGVQTKDANGKALDHEIVMKNIGKSFRGMSQPMANLYAQRLGIDENTELAMRDPNFDRSYDESRKHLGHLDETAKLAHTAVTKGRMAGLSAEDLAAWTAKPLLDKFNQLDTVTGGLSTQIGLAIVRVTELGTVAAIAAKAWKTIAPAAAGGAGAEGGAAAGAAAGSALSSVALPAAVAATVAFAGYKANQEFNTLSGLQGATGKDEASRAMRRAGMEAILRKHGGNALVNATKHFDFQQLQQIVDNMKPSSANASVDPRLLDGIEWNESRGNPNAVSRAGAQGAYQFMPATAKHWGLKDPFNRDQSRAAAGRYMGSLLKRYHGNQTQALQAYNWGPGNMDSYLKTGYGVRGQAMPAETRNYPGQVAKGMTQNNNITINGASDAKATGHEVRKQLVQLQARNTAGVMR